MKLALSPNQFEIDSVLRAFLLAVMPKMEAVLGQDNRVAEPRGGNFIMFTPIRRERIEYNVDSDGDAKFLGTITGAVMTITAVTRGALVVGSQIFGVGVAPVTLVTAFLTGTGGVGTYTVSPVQTVTPEEVLSAGTKDVLQPVQVVYQIDVHGPASADNAQIITTMIEDQYGYDLFVAQNPAVTPLGGSNPRQIPFINGENQYEDRWIVEAAVQANQTVIVPLQYADFVDVALVEVDTTYPP